MQEPHIIAEIPQDVTGSLGKIQASNVCTVAGVQKKKRSEIALAIDRQGLNVYDVRQSMLVASYAVSPQATFTCPPCSLRVRSATGTSTQRLSFCSIKSPNPRLHCFSEMLSSGLGLGGQIVTTTIDLEKGSSPVIHLETMSVKDVDGSTNRANNVLAIHENGDIACYMGRLEKKIWSSRLYKRSGRQVLLAALTNVVQLRRELLKHRDDVVASLGIATEDEEDGCFLIMLTRASDSEHAKERENVALSIFNVNIEDADVDGPSTGSDVRIQEAASIDVPKSSNLKMQNSAFTMHVASGTLYQQTPDSLIVSDMTPLIPKIAHEMAFGEENLLSFLRLSSSTIAMSRQFSFSLVSLPYCSIQAETITDDSTRADYAPLRLLSYLAPLKAMVAIQGRHLIAIQLPDLSPKPRSSRKRKREGLLADSIGRGSYSMIQAQSSQDKTLDHSIKNLGTLLTSAKDKAWKDEKAKLDEDFSRGGLQAISNDMTRNIEMQNPESTFHIDQRKVSYLLAKIFLVRRNDSATDNRGGNRIRLKVGHLGDSDVFNWLVGHGLITNDRVEDLLKQEGLLHMSENLATGAVIEALANEDLSLGLLTSLLAGQAPLRPEDLTSALVIIMRQWNNVAKTFKEPHLITDGVSQPNAMEIEDDDHHQLPQRYPPTTSITKSTRRLLHLILTRLSPVPTTTITPALRSELPTPDLLTLLDILRLEIAHAGWLSPYDATLPTLSPPTAQNNHLADIIHLLNSTIDAIGAGGWIFGTGLSNNEANESADTIAHMKAEISAALEGIQEAVYLKGMLSEVLLCGKEALHAAAAPLKTKMKDDAAPLSDYSTNATKPVVAIQKDGRNSSSSSALPLGLKLTKQVSLTKVAAGGELIGRSKRDIGRLKSRMVGKYSFERIRV